MEKIINGEVINYIDKLLQNGKKIQLEYDKKRKQVKILDLRLKKIKLD